MEREVACHVERGVSFLSPVRFLLPIVLLICGVAAGRAQQQERKLLDRIMQPDTTLEFDLRKSSAIGSRAYAAGSARVKEFHYTQKAEPKTFRTREFHGTKTAWMGDFKFSTKEANSRGKYEIPNAGKSAETKSMRVKQASESDKTMATRALPDGNREYRGSLIRPRSQDRLTQQGPGAQADRTIGWQGGNLKPMTIDDVRELLNKNK